jgi:hypothetical protein
MSIGSQDAGRIRPQDGLIIVNGTLFGHTKQELTEGYDILLNALSKDYEEKIAESQKKARWAISELQRLNQREGLKPNYQDNDIIYD